MDVCKKLGIKKLNPGACSGNWRSTGADQAVLDSVNPATEKVIASVNLCSAADYETLVERSGEAFKQWRQVPAPTRGEMIRLIGAALRQHKDLLGTLVAMETGKIKQEGDGEVQEMIDMADFAVGQARMLYGNTMHSERAQHRMYEQWHPLGTVGVITAFNFPVAVWAWNAFVAAIAGNTVIWKPSPKTPLCAIAVHNICCEVMSEFGFEDVFALMITDDVKQIEIFVDDTRIPLLSFTGSTTVGRKVSQRVSARLGRSLLELSGNNAIIVDETADLKLAVPAIVFGAAGTAGQRCTTTRRVIVHESRAQELVHHLTQAYQTVKIGNPLKTDTLMGPLIDAAAVHAYQQTLEAIIAQGGEVVCGGHAIEGQGHFVQPTIVLAENDWDVVQRETFGPILYIITYRTLDEAIELNNAAPQGLSSAMFTESMRHAEQFLSAVGSDCGIANINIGTSGAEIGGAFGGEKATGGGREAGSDAWKAYMRRQTNTINWGHELPLAQGIEFKL